MSGRPEDNGLEKLKTGVQDLINSCTTVEEQRIMYGNLRYKCSDWDSQDQSVTNIAIIYETPGGSTCQVNVEYDRRNAEFSFLGDELEGTIVTHEPERVLAALNAHIRAIPSRRLEQLYKQIDSWIAEGKTRSQLFSEFNKLLQAEFFGGRISITELKKGIQYALSYFSSSQ